MLFRMGRGCRTHELKVAVVTSMTCPRSNQGNNSRMDEGGATEAPPLAEELLTFDGCCRRDSLFCEREVATGRLRTSQQISPQDVHLDSVKWSQQVIKINKRYLKPGGRCGVAPRGPLEGMERAYDQNTQHTSMQVSKSQLKNYLRNKVQRRGQSARAWHVHSQRTGLAGFKPQHCKHKQKSTSFIERGFVRHGWLMPAVLTLSRLMQEDCKLKDNLSYIVRT